GRGITLLVPQPRDEGDLEAPAIEGMLAIQEVNLEPQRGSPEGRVRTEADDRGMSGLPASGVRETRLDDIDARSRQEGARRDRRYVGRGETQLAPAPIAGADDTGDRIGRAQHPARGHDIAGLEELADAGRGADLAGEFDRRHGLHREAQLAAERRHE